MSRKIMCILISVMFVVLMLPGIANAAGNGNGASNAKLIVASNGNGSASEIKKLEKLVDKANRDIEHAVKKAQATPEDDVQELLAKVDEIAAAVFAYAESIGAKVECIYVEYYIDGQYVLIDPLRIIPL